MNAERWRFVAEMIGITAVVASLLALAVELRQTQLALAAATYQARAVNQIDWNQGIRESEYILPLLARIDVRDPEALNSLTDEERLRLRIFFTSVRIDLDNEYYQYQKGFLDEEYFEHSFKRTLRVNATMWRALGIEERRPSFRAFIDQVIAEERDSGLTSGPQ